MEIILHLGPHRSATATFQHYVSDRAPALARQGIACWGPQRLRQGLTAGLFARPSALRRDPARRAAGRLQMAAALERSRGMRRLLISDADLIGTPRQCLRHATLYPAIGERVARVAAALDWRVTRIVIAPRLQTLYWASLIAQRVGQGHPVPSAARLEAIAKNPRGWRGVITDLACAAPGATITVLPFEQCAGRPNRVLASALSMPAPRPAMTRRLRRAPGCEAICALLAERGAEEESLPAGTGRWMPFSPDQAGRLAETYADDLHWLRAGAEGLAHLTEDPFRDSVCISPPTDAEERGYDNDQRVQGYLAYTGRGGAARAQS